MAMSPARPDWAFVERLAGRFLDATRSKLGTDEEVVFEILKKVHDLEIRDQFEFHVERGLGYYDYQKYSSRGAGHVVPSILRDELSYGALTKASELLDYGHEIYNGTPLDYLLEGLSSFIDLSSDESKRIAVVASLGFGVLGVFASPVAAILGGILTIGAVVIGALGTLSGAVRYFSGNSRAVKMEAMRDVGNNLGMAAGAAPFVPKGLGWSRGGFSALRSGGPFASAEAVTRGPFASARGKTFWGRVFQNVQWILESRHRITVRSIYTMDYEGAVYTVARTNKGKLVLFPYAKKVSVHDVVEMMNRENTGPFRHMEWCGEVMSYEESTMIKGFARTAFRVGGPFEVRSASRKQPLSVWRKVQKTGSGTNAPLEEALHLQKAQREGHKCELPIAVFLGRRNFPEMVFTTHIKGRSHVIHDWPMSAPAPRRLPIPKEPPPIFEDAIRTGNGDNSWVLIDAQYSEPGVYQVTQRFRRKIWLEGFKSVFAW